MKSEHLLPAFYLTTPIEVIIIVSGNESFCIEPDWDLKARQLKGIFSALVDTDLNYVPGKESELLSTVEETLRLTRVEVINILKQLPSEIK